MCLWQKGLILLVLLETVNWCIQSNWRIRAWESRTVARKYLHLVARGWRTVFWSLIFVGFVHIHGHRNCMVTRMVSMCMIWWWGAITIPISLNHVQFLCGLLCSSHESTEWNSLLLDFANWLESGTKLATSNKSNWSYLKLSNLTLPFIQSFYICNVVTNINH